MALYRREKTGEGDRLDISMHDATLAWLPNVLGPVFVEKRAPCRSTSARGAAAPSTASTARPTAGTWCSAGRRPKFVRNLLTEWGRPDLIALCERGPGPHQQPVIDFLQGVFESRRRPSGSSGSTAVTSASRR